MATPIFRPHYSISEMPQRSSLFPSSFSIFPPLHPRIHPHVFHPPLSTIEVEIFEDKEVGKNRIVRNKRENTTKE